MSEFQSRDVLITPEGRLCVYVQPRAYLDGEQLSDDDLNRCRVVGNLDDYTEISPVGLSEADIDIPRLLVFRHRERIASAWRMMQ